MLMFYNIMYSVILYLLILVLRTSLMLHVYGHWEVSPVMLSLVYWTRSNTFLYRCQSSWRTMSTVPLIARFIIIPQIRCEQWSSIDFVTFFSTEQLDATLANYDSDSRSSGSGVIPNVVIREQQKTASIRHRPSSSHFNSIQVSWFRSIYKYW